MAVTKVVALLTIALVTTSSSKSLDRRCVSMQWESALLGQVGQLNQGKGLLFDVVGRLSFDYKLAKQALLEEVYSNGQLIANYKIVTSADGMYLIDLQRKTCALFPGAPVYQICNDSPGLKFVGSWTLGTQMTETYKVNDGYLTFFENPFTVATQTVSQSISGVSQMTTVQFGNVTEGIKDMSVFSLPDYCKSREMETGANLSLLSSLFTISP